MHDDTLNWERTDDRIRAIASDGDVVYEDTIDHWENAVCRLLGRSESDLQQWIQTSYVLAGEMPFSRLPMEAKLKALCEGWRKCHPRAARVQVGNDSEYGHLQVFGHAVDRVWVRGIRDDLSVAVVGPAALEHGILVRTPEAGGGAVPATVYEEEYFEGGIHGTGYGAYRAQMTWRMEKAARQLRQLEGIAYMDGVAFEPGARVLDVGCGYGYFRQAAATRGYVHAGIDVSRHAAAEARRAFGFETHCGSLASFREAERGEFDLITLFDTIEHVSDPVTEVYEAASLLKPGGFLAVRTPNLQAVERDVFGSDYHSLKMEHIHYFGPRSICWVLEQAGLTPRFLTTEAHLLAGVLGHSAVQTHARTLRGSDLLVVGRRLS